MADAMRHGTFVIGERHPNAKATEEDIREIRKLCEAGTPRKTIATRFGLSPNYISEIASGKRRKHVT